MVYTREEVKIPAVDGQLLDASFYWDRDSAICIITCYGLLSYGGSDKQRRLRYECPYGNSWFNNRGEGKNKHNPKTTIENRLEDLTTVMDYAYEEIDVEKIGLFGTSFGCYISALKAMEDDRVKAMVLIAPFPPKKLLTDEELNGDTYEITLGNNTYTFEEEFLKSLREHGSETIEVKRPTLVIGGKEDELVDIKNMRKFYNEHLTGEKDFLKIDGADHAITDPPHRKIAIEASVDWFNKHLSQHSFV